MEHGRMRPKVVRFTENKTELEDLYDMEDLEIDYGINLLGNRWLERGMGALVIAPSGVGKSGFVVQCAACSACSREAFGIPCTGSLRQIIIQNEDSRNDMIEMARIIDQLQPTKQEAQLIKQN